ncbi:MAG: trigger factor [Firmicutes bacterium]|nr:trigger factor [Bacillota bacterium]
MKSTWERVEPSKAQFEVEVDPHQVEEAMDKAYRKLVRRVNIPGFRKGKAPRAIVERYLGRGALLEEALDIVVPEAYNQAMEESGLDPIDQPNLDIVKMEDGESLVFKAEVAVKPDVELGQYQGFEIERDTPEVTEDEVGKQLELLQERHAQLVSAGDEQALENGFFGVIDFEGFLDGEPFDGGKAEGYLLEIGSGTFVPGFEEQIIGAKVGEERDIQVTFPENYRATELAGKPVTFKVKVREVKKKELPALDDAFAKEASSFQTLQELRQDLTNRLEEAAKSRVNAAFERRVVEKVVEEAKVEPPEVLIHRQVHRLMDDFAQQLAMSSLSLEDWMAQTGKDDHALHEEFEPTAKQQVKTDLVLEAIAKKEGLEVSDQEVREEIERVSKRYGSQSEETRKYLSSLEGMERVRETLRMDKAVKRLAELQTPVPAKKSSD